jgi:alkylation response protein AidB-like acyl-CoA dehydrogenase
MNFDFSEDLNLLREQARRFLSERCPPQAARTVLEGGAPLDRALWAEIAGMGWLGAITPERFGGVELGHEGLCVLAEEIGRAVAPVPFGSSVYLATQAILAHGSDAQREQWLPKLADGSVIGTLALAEGMGNPSPASIALAAKDGRLTGAKWPVTDGSVADLAVTLARDADGGLSLYLVDLRGAGVARDTLKSIDPTRDQAKLAFDGAAAERLGAAGAGWDALQALLDRAAVLFAFEQVGGAQACLDMARDFAHQRFAFGRPIGSFQAIKHKLADVYMAVELARSNAYFGAWALATDAPELPLAGAAARVAATDAYHLASKENIQTHGGMGFTWQADCHLFYRRARQLALAIGSAPWWKNRLVDQWDARTAH